MHVHNLKVKDKKFLTLMVFDIATYLDTLQ